MFFFLKQALHIHVTGATYQLLERKLYEVQERSKMTINDTSSIVTYFILNKKDRYGKFQPRPFHPILQEIKRKETEEAKLKQSNSLMDTNILSSRRLTTKENGVVPSSSTKNDSQLISNESVAPSITIADDSTSLNQNASIKTLFDDEGTIDIDEQNDSEKVLHRLTRSRTCELV